MSLQPTWKPALAAAIALCVFWPTATPAFAVSPTAEAAADRARAESAVRRYEQARARSAELDARARRLTAELDRVLVAQRTAQKRLDSRARSMYRTDPTEVVSLLLGASTFEELTSRWDLLLIIGDSEAEDLRALRALRAETERSAESVLALQSEQARAEDAVAREVARARKELASSRAALARYRARTSSPADDAPEPQPALHGSGPWKTALASHYGINFSGRSASGERIGPYSMIVAHKTLPFGTLIEFEYKGKRAVARVVDRGPRSPERTFDLGPGVVRVLDFSGVHNVRYRLIQR